MVNARPPRRILLRYLKMSGFGHLWRPRNFILKAQLSREDFLAKCHWHFTPYRFEYNFIQPNKNSRHRGRLFYLARERDSNPRRDSSPSNDLANRPLQPLGYPLHFI